MNLRIDLAAALLACACVAQTDPVDTGAGGATSVDTDPTTGSAPQPDGAWAWTTTDGYESRSAIYADFNGDGLTDIAWDDWYYGTFLRVLYAPIAQGYHDPAHADAVIDTLGKGNSFLAGDVNGDGRMDVWVGPNLLYGPLAQYTDVASPEASFVGTLVDGNVDIDADGYFDVVYQDPDIHDTGVPSVLWGPLAGKLDPTTRSPLFDCEDEPIAGVLWGTLSQGLVQVDLDGDGRNELVTRESACGGTAVAWSLPGGRVLDQVPAWKAGVPMGDLDGDGYEDVYTDVPSGRSFDLWAGPYEDGYHRRLTNFDADTYAFEPVADFQGTGVDAISIVAGDGHEADIMPGTEFIANGPKGAPIWTIPMKGGLGVVLDPMFADFDGDGVTDFAARGDGMRILRPPAELAARAQ